jgi:hypothetical protein
MPAARSFRRAVRANGRIKCGYLETETTSASVTTGQSCDRRSSEMQHLKRRIVPFRNIPLRFPTSTVGSVR